MHLLILPYLDCSDSHAYTISLELCAGFNDSTHKTSLLYFEYVILYAPLHKDKLRTTAGDRGGAGLFAKFSKKKGCPLPLQEEMQFIAVFRNLPQQASTTAVSRGGAKLVFMEGAYRITYSKYSNDVL